MICPPIWVAFVVSSLVPLDIYYPDLLFADRFVEKGAIMNILFLGDSITDCDHCFTRDNLGTGYVKMLSLLPGITVTNGGTDGFTFPDVLRKWRQMYAQNTYDCVVMTCGINDVGVIADLNEAGRPEIASAFFRDSMAALQTFLEEVTGITSSFSEYDSFECEKNDIAIRPEGFAHASRILLLEPFLFPIPKARTHWLPILNEVRAGIRAAAAAFHDVPATEPACSPGAAYAKEPASGGICVQYLPTQAVLDDLASGIGFPSVTTDGIHPTARGHECLAGLVAGALGIR